MTVPHFTDRAAAARWLHDQAGTITALREYGTRDEVDLAVIEFEAVAAQWPSIIPPTCAPRALPWHIELAIVAVFTVGLLGFFWLTGSLR